MELALISMLVAVIFSIPLVLYLLSYKYKPRSNATASQQTPPGSTGWPFIGETIEFVSATTKGACEKFINIRKQKYSPKIFQTSLLGQRMVILCSPEGNKFIFSNENKTHTSWWPSSIDKFFDTQNVSRIEESTKMRNFAAPILKPDTLRKYISIVDAKAKEHLHTYWDGKEVIEVYPSAKDLTFKLACRLLFGIEDQEAMAKLHKRFAVFLAGLYSMPIDLPGTKFRRSIKASKELRKEFEGMIKKWKIDISENRMSPSYCLFSQQVHEDNQPMTDYEMATRILALLSASYDNVSTTMSFVIKYLAEMPNVYEEVLREQREIASAKAPGEFLNWDDIQKMRYTWNVTSEVLRLHSPTFGFFREVITDFNYEGFLIPKGWKLHWNAYATHKSPECFPDPEKFDPSRFEGNKLVPYSYVPFGGGPHTCPGKEYARIAILVLVHNVVTKFKLEKVLPHEGIIGLPVYRPAKGLPLRLLPHKL